MDKDLQKYYDEQFNMMATLGWKEFISDLENTAKTYNTVDSINTIETLYFRKGQLDILNWVLSRKTTLEEAYKDLTNA